MRAVALALLVVVLGTACGSDESNTTAEPAAETVTPGAVEAPVEGGTEAFEAYRGKPVVANVWAS